MAGDDAGDDAGDEGVAGLTMDRRGVLPWRGGLHVVRGRRPPERGALLVVAVGEVEADLLKDLVGELGRCLGVRVAERPPLPLPLSAFDATRRQFYGPAVLAAVAALASEGGRCLGVADVDLFAPGSNFALGIADARARSALMSLYRLRPERYGLAADPRLLRARAAKEAVHEAGHAYRLGHCPHQACVMNFSNTLEDTDKRGAGLCLGCRLRLDRALHEGR